jgi:hypothetical protein
MRNGGLNELTVNKKNATMKETLDLFKNVKKGPKSTIAGLVLFLFSGYSLFTNEQTYTYASVEVGLLITGLYLFVSSDGLIKKKEDKVDDEK